MTPEQLTERRALYQKAEREAASRLRRAEEKLTGLVSKALAEVPRERYKSVASDTRGRHAEQDVILSENPEVVRARTLVHELKDQLEEARDLNSDMSFYQRERLAESLRNLNSSLTRMDKTVQAFTAAVDLFVQVKTNHRPHRRIA